MTKCFALFLLLIGPVFAHVSTVQAKDEKAKGTVLLKATVSKEAFGAAVTSFSNGDAMVYINYESETLTKGDKIRMVCILENGGKTVKKNAKVSEFTLVADGPKGKGNFHLDKPATGWPMGKYRVEIYDNAVLAQTVKFTIK